MNAKFVIKEGVRLMNKTMTIWERQYDLPVVFDCFDNEEVLPIQKQALEAFLKAENTIQESKKQLEKYILNDEYAEIEGNSIDNIFKYVGQYVGQDKLRHGAEHLNGKPHRHTQLEGLEITEYMLHFCSPSCPSAAFARSSILASTE